MRRFTLLMLVLIAMMMSLQAQSKFEVDGIYYEKYANTTGSVFVTYKGSDYFTPSYTGVVTIPDKVVSNGETYDVVGIGCGAFYDCDVLEVNLPQSLLEVDVVSFYGCTSLSAITLPDNVVSIGAASFMGCENLATVNMSRKLEDLCEYAFYGTRVSHIELPKTVENISGKTFSGMNFLESINVAEDNPYFCSIEGVLYSKDKSEILAIPMSKLDNFVIPYFVTTLGGNVFYGSKQEEIFIPATVSEMSRLAFTNMPNLKRVTVDKENANYYDVDGVPFAAATEELMFFPKGRTETNYSVPEGTKNIGALAFDGSDKLKEVTIPGSVECIGDSAFNNCCDIQQLHFNEGSLKSIGVNAFRGCMDMLSFTIPNTVSHLGWGAFNGCSSMPELVFGSSVEYIGLGCCIGADNLRDVYVMN
ncbi:MAG: leucine-rich repeat protein, partial [Muribaculaceae bacterium]